MKLRQTGRKMRELMKDNLSAAADIFCASTLFTLFAYFNWVASGNEIPYDVIWKLVQPFYLFSAEPALLPVIESGWAIPGRQFFLFPLLSVLGTDPLAIKIIQVAGFALIGPLIYLALSRKFDRYIGLTAGLLFISMRLIEKWRNGDVYLAVLSSMILFLLYVEWERNDKPIYLYGMGLIAGFGIYIKTTVIFPVVGMLLATLILKYSRIRTLESRKKLGFAGALLLGLSPLLIYGFANEFANSYLMYTLKNLPGLQEAVSTRLSQFHRVTAPGGPVANAVNQRSFHVYTLAFISGSLISIYRKRDRVYLLGFFLTVAASFVSPKAHLPVHQMLVIYPFFLVMISQNLVELQNIKGLHRLAPLAIIYIIFLTSGHLHVSDVHPGSVTTDEFRDFKELKTGEVVGTNSRHAVALTELDPDSSAKVAASPNWTYKFFIDRNERINLSAIESSEADSWLLLRSKHCEVLFYGAARCGYETEKVKEKLDGLNSTNVTIGRYSYIFLR